MSNIYLALVHHPIINKRGEKVTTSVTNMDIHDIARSCRTFGIKNYFIVTPIEKQQELVGEILEYWNQDFAHDYNPDRHDALSFIKVKQDLQATVGEIEESEQRAPLIAVTGANFKTSDGDMIALQEKAQSEQRPILLLFGTGWGLHPEALELAHFRLGPIKGKADDGYNHLSVRSAVAIYLAQRV